MIQYFLENLWLAWLLVSLLCLVLELTNGDFFIICCHYRQNGQGNRTHNTRRIRKSRD